MKKESKEQNAVQLMVNNEEKLRATLTEKQLEKAVGSARLKEWLIA